MWHESSESEFRFACQMTRREEGRFFAPLGPAHIPEMLAEILRQREASSADEAWAYLEGSLLSDLLFSVLLGEVQVGERFSMLTLPASKEEAKEAARCLNFYFDRVKAQFEDRSLIFFGAAAAKPVLLTHLEERLDVAKLDPIRQALYRLITSGKQERDEKIKERSPFAKELKDELKSADQFRYWRWQNPAQEKASDALEIDLSPALKAETLLFTYQVMRPLSQVFAAFDFDRPLAPSIQLFLSVDKEGTGALEDLEGSFDPIVQNLYIFHRAHRAPKTQESSVEVV